MKKKFPFFHQWVTLLVLTVLAKPVLAVPDSLSYPMDSMEFIQFKTPYEELVFRNLDSMETIDMLLAICENADNQLVQKIKNRVNTFSDGLTDQKLERKSAKKKIKIIFNQTHKEFFDKYIEVSDFDHIFQSREYNCVSATALYSLIFELHNIPYSIHETPAHVFVEAYPGEESIVVESTAPIDGFYQPSAKDIDNSVNSLLEMKYVSPSEVDSMGVKAVYDSFFFADQGRINLRELAGIQYMNEAIVSAEDGDMDAAFNSIQKCRILYPSKKADELTSSILIQLLTNSGYDSLKDVRYLCHYANLPNSDRNWVLEMTNNTLNNHLFISGKLELMDTIFGYMRTHIKNPDLKKSIEENYYSYYSQYYHQTSRCDKALEYAKVSHELNPNNTYIRALINECVFKKYMHENPGFFIFMRLNADGEDYPFLMERSDFQRMRYLCLAHLAYLTFDGKQLDSGLVYLNEMDSLFDKFGAQLSIPTEVIADAYGKGGMLCYKQRDYQQAKEITDRGLKYAPDNTSLTSRLSYIHRKLGLPPPKVRTTKDKMRDEQKMYEEWLKSQQK